MQQVMMLTESSPVSDYMKTEMLLMAQYEKPVIPLEYICQEYFGLAPASAKQKASSATLPIPAVRLGNSQKSPWVIHIFDLAKYIDEKRQEAEDEWRSVNT